MLEYLPGVAVVLDHFHVVKLMNDRLTEVRRKLHRELQDTMSKNVLKGSRWILLKNPESLNLQRQEHERLQEALEANEPLAKAYYLKEELRQIWKQPNKAAAGVYLEQWIRSALASDVGPLVKMGKTMAMNRTGILAWYDHPISSGPMEGSNNKIKTLKRQAYGYREMRLFFRGRYKNDSASTMLVLVSCGDNSSPSCEGQFSNEELEMFQNRIESK